MRTGLIVCLMMAGVALPSHAQPGKDKSKSTATSRTILANLQTEMDTAPLGEPLRVAHFLAHLNDVIRGHKKEVAILVDEAAFREENPENFDILEQEIRLRGLPAKASVHLVLRQALKQLQPKSAFVIRAGKVEIMPLARTAKEYMLNQTFDADFSERRLDQAMEELSELTGVSIVIDGRARQKAQTAVTARFHDDVALQDAVRMLAEMAELKIVYLVTGLYVTTPEHAQMMQKELRKAYGETETPPAPGRVPQLADPLFMPADLSPLMPPLPPGRFKRDPISQ